MKYLLIAVILSISVSCQNHHQNDQIVLRYAYGSNSQVVKDSITEFGRIIEERSGGQIKLIYFPDSQLGGERELIELVQTGAIHFTKVGAAILENFSNDYAILSMPYIFDHQEHFYSAMDDRAIVESIYQSTYQKGFVGLTYYDSGARSFYTKNNPIYEPKDLNGLKIRTMESPTAIRMVQLLGGSPTPMANTETYTSLQQGILDGSENNEFALTEAGHGEVVNFYSYSEHTRIPDIVIMNSETLKLLTPDQQKIIAEAAIESTEYQKKLWNDAVNGAKMRIADQYQVAFNDVDKEPFRQAMAPLYQELLSNSHKKTIYDQIRKINEIEEDLADGSV